MLKQFAFIAASAAVLSCPAFAADEAPAAGASAAPAAACGPKSTSPKQRIAVTATKKYLI